MSNCRFNFLQCFGGYWDLGLGRVLGQVPDTYSNWFMVAGNDWGFSVSYLWANKVGGERGAVS